MKIRNKSATWYRDAKVTIQPQATVEVSAHDGHELLRLYPWHFEEVKAEKRARGEGAASEAGGDSGVTEERTAPAPRSRQRGT